MKKKLEKAMLAMCQKQKKKKQKKKKTFQCEIFPAKQKTYLLDSILRVFCIIGFAALTNHQSETSEKTVQCNDSLFPLPDKNHSLQRRKFDTL